MENAEGLCIASLTDHVRLVSESKALCNSERISPTTNGVAIWSACSDGNPYSFTLEVSKPVLEVRANDKCFALMSEKFRPFIVVSCLGTTDANDNIIFPAKLRYEKLCDCKYSIIISPCSTLGKSVAFELNLYESKLFQDTTVESKNPEINNVFGSVGFIGSTKEFGEQWLYTRPDISKMNDLYEKEILGAILHLPRLNHSEIALTASRVSERFCSFGSTWDNRIATASSFSNPLIREHYLDLNIMPILTNKYGKLVQSEGFILKAKANSSDFAVIATADNYFHPQIFEINYK